MNIPEQMQILFCLETGIQKCSKHLKRQDFGYLTVQKSIELRMINLQTFEFATLLGVPAVPTKIVRISRMISHTFPVVLKTVDGHGGNEVYLCTSDEEAEVFIQTVQDR